MTDVTEKTWEEAVIRRSGETPVVVDFWAEWCKPCLQLTPTLEDAVAGREVVLTKVDIDANQALAREYNVSGIPAVKAFRNGQVVAEFVGVKSRQSVDAWLDDLLKPPVAETLEDGDVAAALRAGDYERALETLLAHAEDPAQRDETRKVMVALFNELGQDHPLSVAYRRRLAALLY
jgi:putative thioredoxin